MGNMRLQRIVDAMNIFNLPTSIPQVPKNTFGLRFSRVTGQPPRRLHEVLTYAEVGQIMQEAAQSAQRQGKVLEGKTFAVMAVMASDAGDMRFDKPLTALIDMASTLAPFLKRTPLVEKLYRLACLSPDQLPSAT